MNGWEALGFKSYQEYLDSNFWKQKRKWIIKCFGNLGCQRCKGMKGLIVHHLNYKNVGNEGGEDVTVLCWDCHKKEHEK